MSIHPLLGNRLEAPQPSWHVALDTAGLSYLPDHRIGELRSSFRAPDMSRWRSRWRREMFGPVPCVLEDIEFSEIPVPRRGRRRAPPRLCSTPTRASSTSTRAPMQSDNSWDLHARGCVRQASQATPATVDLATIRRQDPMPPVRRSYYRLFADLGFDYGPTFRGIAQLWRGEREALAEIHVPTRSAASSCPTIDCIRRSWTPAFNPYWRRCRRGRSGRRPRAGPTSRSRSSAFDFHAHAFDAPFRLCPTEGIQSDGIDGGHPARG